MIVIASRKLAVAAAAQIAACWRRPSFCFAGPST